MQPLVRTVVLFGYLAATLARSSTVAFTCCNGEASCGSTQNDAGVCSSLGDMYYALNGPGWYPDYPKPNSWNCAAAGSPTNYCNFSFYGLECSPAGNLTTLTMSSQSMIGILPATLGAITSLERLLLSNTLLRGPLPDSLGQLSLLTSITIMSSAINGTIPDLSSAKGLQELHLDYNGLSGSLGPWLGALSQLTDCSFMSNRLSGTLPDYLGSLTSLTVRQLRDGGPLYHAGSVIKMVPLTHPAHSGP
jgi:hypothetical protein